MLGFIVAGLVIGAIARLLRPGPEDLGLLATLLIGLAGSIVGGLIASLFGTGDIWELNVLGFVLAVVAAIVFVGVAEGIAAGRRNVT